MKMMMGLAILATMMNSFAGEWATQTFTGTGSVNFNDGNSATYRGDCTLTLASNKDEGKMGISIIIDGMTAFNAYYQNGNAEGFYSSIMQESGSVPRIRKKGSALFSQSKIHAVSKSYLSVLPYSKHEVSIQLDDSNPTHLTGRANKGHFSCDF